MGHDAGVCVRAVDVFELLCIWCVNTVATRVTPTAHLQAIGPEQVAFLPLHVLYGSGQNLLVRPFGSAFQVQAVSVSTMRYMEVRGRRTVYIEGLLLWVQEGHMSFPPPVCADWVSYTGINTPVENSLSLLLHVCHWPGWSQIRPSQCRRL